MEKLLNKLIEKGWKPFGVACTDFIKGTGLECIPSYCFNPHPHMGFPGGTRKYHRPSLRQIVSKESGLWQFCCKNRLTNRDEKSDWSKNAERDEDGVIDRDCLIFSSDYEYWLLETSLKDDSELENFLLSNIKVDGTTK